MKEKDNTKKGKLFFFLNTYIKKHEETEYMMNKNKNKL